MWSDRYSLIEMIRKIESMLWWAVEQNITVTWFSRTDDVSVEVVGLVPQKIMLNGWGDEEQVLLFISGWCSWQLSNIVNKACHSSKIVRLDNLEIVKDEVTTKSPCRWRIRMSKFLKCFYVTLINFILRQLARRPRWGRLHDLITSHDETFHSRQSLYKVLLGPHEGCEIIDVVEKDGAPANILKRGTWDNEWITLFDRKFF